jgi:hypothetical protein
VSRPGDPAGPRRGLVVIGAPKSGSTALYDYLAATDLFAVPDRKETRYFVDPASPGARQENAATAADPLRSYLDLFRPAERDVLLEATPDYYHDATALRHLTDLRESLERLVVVCVVRDPVARLRSMFYFARDTIGTVSADRALDDFGRDVLAGDDRAWRSTPVLWDSFAIGSYGGLLAPWAEAFGDDLVVVPYEWMTGQTRPLAADLLGRVGLADGAGRLADALPRSNATVRPASYRLHSLVRAASRRWSSESALRRRMRSAYDRVNAARTTTASTAPWSDEIADRLRKHYAADAPAVAALVSPMVPRDSLPAWLAS